MPFDSIVLPSPAGSVAIGQLPRAQLVHAVAQVVLDARRYRRLPSAPEVCDRLWREDPQEVATILAAYLRDAFSRDARLLEDFFEPIQERPHDLHSERLRALRRPIPYRKDIPNRSVTEIAAAAGIDRAALVALMVRHGYLNLVPYDGSQRRHLVSDRAVAGGLGHNVDASRARAVVEGLNRCTVFPVFYADVIPDILWTLDHAGILEATGGQGTKKRRLRWLLEHHNYLPNAEIARVSGYTERGVEKARQLAEAADAVAAPPCSPALQAMLTGLGYVPS